MKKIVKNRPTNDKKLEFHRETLVRLQEGELNKAGGAVFDWPPVLGGSESAV